MMTRIPSYRRTTTCFQNLYIRGTESLTLVKKPNQLVFCHLLLEIFHYIQQEDEMYYYCNTKYSHTASHGGS
jgi:hypothetical protein